MKTQYVATRLSCGQLFEASSSQPRRLIADPYLFGPLPAILSTDCTQAVVTSKRGQAGHTGSVGFKDFDRSIRCPRASSFLPCSVLLQALPPVAAASSLQKSSLSLIPSRSASSPSIPASTSKQNAGRASGSVRLFARFHLGAFGSVLAVLRRIGSSRGPHFPISLTQEGGVC